MNCITYMLVIVLLHCEVKCIKIRDRFDMKALAQTRLRVLVPEVDGILRLNPKHDDPAGTDLYSTLHRPFNAFNWSDTFTESINSGTHDEYGNYSGMVGMVQRGEVDVATSIVRPDALPFEPVRIGPVIGSDELRFLSPKRKGTEKFLDVILIVYNFDLLTYSYIFYCTYCVIAMALIVQVTATRREGKLKRKGLRRVFALMWKSTCKYCWSICEIFLDQENLNPVTWSDRILWLHYCLACFFTICGFFLNLMSTEMVAESPLPRISKLADLFDEPHFANTRAAVVTNLPSYNLIRDAPADTHLRLLKENLNVDTDYSLIYVNASDVAPQMQRIGHLQGALKGDDRCLVSSDYVIGGVRMTVCAARPAVMKNFYRSQSFADGMLTYYFNHKLGSNAVRFLSNRIAVAYEAALYGELGKNAVRMLLPKIGLNYGWTTMKCYDELGGDDNVVSEEQAAMGLQLKSTLLTFRLGGVCLAAAALVWMIERIISEKHATLSLAQYFIRKARKFYRLFKRKARKIRRSCKRRRFIANVIPINTSSEIW